jgi:hypothetical protein
LKNSGGTTVKKTLCAIAVVAMLLSVTAFAKTKKGTDALVKSTGAEKGKYVAQPAEVPPSYCAPVCLLYTGDTNPNSLADNGFANENTLLVPDTQDWGAFTVPAGQTWTVDGAFINTITDGYNGLDPSNSSWSINSGVSEGNGGSVVASGTSTASGTQFTPTGRFPFGFTEYTLKVHIVPAVTLSAGTYWLNITPQCTDSGNGDCDIAQYFWDDTFGLNNYGSLPPANDSFFNSSYFGFDYANLCEVSSTGCQVFSFGIIGTGTTD